MTRQTRPFCNQFLQERRDHLKPIAASFSAVQVEGCRHYRAMPISSRTEFRRRFLRDRFDERKELLADPLNNFCSKVSCMLGGKSQRNRRNFRVSLE